MDLHLANNEYKDVSKMVRRVATIAPRQTKCLYESDLEGHNYLLSLYVGDIY